MEPTLNRAPLRRAGLAVLATIVVCTIFPTEAAAVSRFGVERQAGQEPAEIDFDDIWLYGKDGSKQIPDIALDWLAAAFNLLNVEAPSSAFEGQATSSDVFLERGEEIAGKYPEIVGVTYDRNLAEDACFFTLREGVTETELKGLIRALNGEEAIAYTHPTLRVEGKTFAYFNAFQMKWKDAVSEASRTDLMEQAHVFFDSGDQIYRVDVMATPFFKAVNLLAQDIRVMDVTPVLVPIESTIRVELSVPLQGCQLGDRIPFTLRIDFSDRLRVDPSSLVNINLRPAGIQKELFDLKFEPYDYVKAASNSPVNLTGWMKLYSPGEFVIPAVEIHYDCRTCSGEPVRAIRTTPIPIQVASLIPAKAKKPGLVIPMDDLRPMLDTEALRDRARGLLWQGLPCLLLGVVLMGVWGRKWYVQKKAGQGELVERREDVLADRLRGYLAVGPTGPHWVYAGDAGKLLREYLAARYGLDMDPDRGTGEVFLAGARARLPDGIVSRLLPLLKEIDRMIALETGEYTELERWRSDTLSLLDRAQSKEP